MPVAGIAAGFAVDALAGSTIAAGVADLGITGVAASAATGAVEGAIGGGLTAAVTGQDVGKGILGGAVTGGIGAGVTSEVSSALAAPDPGTVGPPMPPGYDTLGPGASLGLARGIETGAGSFVGGTAGALATGQPLGRALESGAIGGISNLLGNTIGGAADLGGLGTSALTGVLNYGLTQALAPSAKGASASSAAYQPTLAQNVASPGISNAPNTSLLGSALNVGGTSGYTPGGTVFGSSDSNTPPSNVWNQATLRDTTVGQG
jgi:hypothetical protein